MEFRILGPLYADARTGSGPAVISQPLLQSALAVLLLRANMPCPRSMLIETLWGSEPPGSPDAALRVCISRLRRCLGDCAERLDSVGPPGGRAPGHRQQRGYMMTVRPGELDVDEFTDLVAQGQAELDVGNAAAAAASFVHALALWGDPPLPDLPESEVIAAAVGRLKNQRQGALDALIEARLAAGQPEQVLGQLRAAVSAEPARERTSAQLMRAYHALGMRTEALDVYQQARQATLEQQGAEPGPVLSLLYQRILAEELASPAPPTALSLGVPTLPGSQVPAPPADFTGRPDEVTSVIDCLSGAGVPVTVITGGPGAGKSATAATVALHLRRRFPDGQLYAELGGVERPRDPQEVLADLLQSMGVPARSIPLVGPARSAMYRSLLAGRKVLVVADDAATAAQVRPLIPAAGGAAVLVTSRGRLSGLAGARTVELPGLAPEHGLRLLDLAAGPGRIAAEPEAARAIVEACAGLPLALRLAGAVLAARPGLTVARLAGDCAGHQVLDVLVADDSSVRAAIESSYRALPGRARAALGLAAAAIPGEIPAWALTELGDGDDSVGDRIAAVGLLMPARVEVAGKRYQMHPLVRAYARERATPYEDSGTGALARLRAGWLHRADRASARVPALPFLAAPPFVLSPGTLRVQQSAEPGAEAEEAWLEAERASLLAVAEQSCAAGDHAEAIALASRMTADLCRAGAFQDAIRVWRAIAEAAAVAGDAAGAAMAGYCLAAALAATHEQIGEATALLRNALPELERAGEMEAAAMGNALLGRCASAEGRHAAAIRAVRRALRLADGTTSADLVRCCATAVLGLTLARVGIASSGLERCQHALSEAARLGEPGYEAYATSALAQALIVSGAYSEAADACTDGIGLCERYGSRIAAARFRLLLGRAHQCLREHEAAAESFLAAAEVFRDLGLGIEEITARSMLAACLGSAGDPVEAAEHVSEVSQILARKGVAEAEAKAWAARDACVLAADQSQHRPAEPGRTEPDRMEQGRALRLISG
jgi:DNA-binding SARP family transcriptional activator